MKVLLVSAGVISLAVGLRFSVPIAVNGFPAAYSFVLSWLKPPYLYLIINGIIITIAAASRFHDTRSESPPIPSEILIPVETQRFEPAPAEIVVSEIEDAIVELRPVTVNGLEVEIESEQLVETVAEEEPRVVDVFVDDWKFQHASTPPAPEEIISEPEVQLEYQFPVREKPLLASRFGHRKANRTTPEGAKTLRVSRAKKHETLESTWKMITEGRHVPLTRHLKKTDTWEQGGHVTTAVPKSETFKDRSSNYPAASRIGKESSLGQDELNRRVEAFINKFNQEMRMQRQESMMNKYAQIMMKQ